MIPWADTLVTLDQLAFLGAGFVLGILASLLLARVNLAFFSRRLKDMSNQALYDNSVKFMDLARSHFTG